LHPKRSAPPLALPSLDAQNKVLLERLEGADASELALRVERLQKPTDAAALAAGASIKPLDELTRRLQRLVTASPVMLFMKGSPESPKCKFSRQAVELLKEAGISFGSFGGSDLRRVPPREMRFLLPRPD